MEEYDSKGLRQGRFASGLEPSESKGFRQGRFLECFADSVENKGLRQGRIGAQSLNILQDADSKGFGQGRIFTRWQFCFQVHGNKEVTQEPSCAEASDGRGLARRGSGAGAAGEDPDTTNRGAKELEVEPRGQFMRHVTT